VSKTPRNYLLLVLILAFSFVYRVVLMLRETFPPGADIGLHNSVIHSIIQSGNTNFLYNYYHMGGGSSVTFPGYHIFTAYIILMTGLTDYVAQALVVSMFSALIVLVAFLLTRKIWNVSAAIIVAFLIAVSRFDIEMIMWGGYPNVVTLMLIPLSFYLFLEKDKLTLAPFLVVTSLVSGAIFLTHSLSAVLFIAITFATLFLITIFAGKMGERRMNYYVWVVPLILGAIIISPFLLQVSPAYLGSDAAAFTGGIADIREALLSTKILPFEIVIPLFIFVFLYPLFSKYYHGKWLTVPTILIVLWWLIPTVLTQGYLVGLYTDYNRFLYYLILPVVMLIGLGLYHSARFISKASDTLISFANSLPEVRISKSKTLRKLMPNLANRNFLLVFVFIFVMYAFLEVPIFASPSQGIGVQSFYQLMNTPGYEAIQWAQKNTPTNTTFLTDAEYGWWFGGFALRPTISAVEPQYLTNAREFEPAKIARYVLDTDYLIDNGILQVREDGGYIARHNPEFLAKLNDSYFPYGFFNFNNGEITITLRDTNGNVQILDLSTIPVINQHIENNTDNASIFVTRGNQLFNLTEVTTVYQGTRFANMNITMEASNPTITFDTIRLLLHTKGLYIPGENTSTLAFFDTNMKVAGQLIFTNDQPETKIFTSENPSSLEMTYNLDGNSSTQLSFYAGVYQYPANPSPILSQAQQTLFYQAIVQEKARTYQEKVSDTPLDVFDYQQALQSQSISYVVVRDSEQIPRFSKDPWFSLVFINNGVAIFQVRNATYA
jgi:hypothetical protein